jgi:tetratricopeptide (TPR) repeat protein
MPLEAGKGVLVFFSYSHRDKWWRDELEKHLSDLKYRGLISTWYDQDILAGEEWDRRVGEYLDNAQIVLLLISADFMASPYCYGREMKRALERYERKEVDVFPVLLRAVYYEDAPFAKLHILPINRIPIKQWGDPEEAFVEIACVIARVARRYLPKASAKRISLLPLSRAIRSSITNFTTDLISRLALRRIVDDVERRVDLGSDYYYIEALEAYQHALASDPSDGSAYWGMGNVLYALKRYDEALQAFMRAVNCGPVAVAYAGLGNVLAKLERYEEAIAAYEKAIELDPTVTFNFDDLLQSYLVLGRKEEANQAYARAKQLGYEE